MKLIYGEVEIEVASLEDWTKVAVTDKDGNVTHHLHTIRVTEQADKPKDEANTNSG